VPGSEFGSHVVASANRLGFNVQALVGALQTDADESDDTNSPSKAWRAWVWRAARITGCEIAGIPSRDLPLHAPPSAIQHQGSADSGYGAWDDVLRCLQMAVRALGALSKAEPAGTELGQQQVSGHTEAPRLSRAGSGSASASRTSHSHPADMSTGTDANEDEDEDEDDSVPPVMVMQCDECFVYRLPRGAGASSGRGPVAHTWGLGEPMATARLELWQ